LPVGQVIFVGTDGVWEMPDVKGEAFGKDRQLAIIREFADRPAADISAAIHERLTQFRGDARQVDDVTDARNVLAFGTPSRRCARGWTEVTGRPSVAGKMARLAPSSASQGRGRPTCDAATDDFAEAERRHLVRLWLAARAP
jgi:hypothetical protein